MKYNELNGEFIVNLGLDAPTSVYNALRDFEKSRVYMRIDTKTGLKTPVGDTGSLDIWITDFEKGEAFLEVGPHINGIINIVLHETTYEAE